MQVSRVQLTALYKGSEKQNTYSTFKGLFKPVLYFVVCEAADDDDSDDSVRAVDDRNAFDAFETS